MPTIYEIAKLANVSPTTVSQVLNGRRKMVWPSMIAKAERIRRIADSLGYRPHSAARSLCSQQTHQVGALLLNSKRKPLHYPAAFEYVMGINQRLETEQYVLSVVRIGDVIETDMPLSRVFQEQMLEGMIIVGNLPDAVADHVRQLVRKLVWLDSDVWETKGCLRQDERANGQLVANQAIDAGYKRLVWAMQQPSDGSTHYSIRERLKGITETAAMRGVELVQRESPPFGQASADAWFGSVALPGTAVLAYDSHIGIRLAFELTQRGLPLGQRVGVASCDCSHEGHLSFPSLSTVINDRLQLGVDAADLLLAAINGKAMESRQAPGRWLPGSTLGRYAP